MALSKQKYDAEYFKIEFERLVKLAHEHGVLINHKEHITIFDGSNTEVVDVYAKN
ncbi:hypothetical protein M2454_003090 [Aequitasia blattaphilus]|uniref:Uncharacterized protein n=1 Tax=Aequitasia blattaphilus TaxID=2949332 RepID=A0ABT1ED27_9FIRM|nr:hypothetical protein [Aequitasia blattaphilus]MCP1103739.1 hypothetical protein [Aequitasia blattaphilus]MCR8616379.1 hypothetical protein [Aequitasia blattaphilus]